MHDLEEAHLHWEDANQWDINRLSTSQRFMVNSQTSQQHNPKQICKFYNEGTYYYNNHHGAYKHVGLIQMMLMSGQYMGRSIVALFTLPIHIGLILWVLVHVLFIYKVFDTRAGFCVNGTCIRVNIQLPSAPILLLVT